MTASILGDFLPIIHIHPGLQKFVQHTDLSQSHQRAAADNRHGGCWRAYRWEGISHYQRCWRPRRQGLRSNASPTPACDQPGSGKLRLAMPGNNYARGGS
jgi:hypothetical protein